MARDGVVKDVFALALHNEGVNVARGLLLYRQCHAHGAAVPVTFYSAKCYIIVLLACLRVFVWCDSGFFRKNECTAREKSLYLRGGRRQRRPTVSVCVCVQRIFPLCIYSVGGFADCMCVECVEVSHPQ